MKPLLGSVTLMLLITGSAVVSQMPLPPPPLPQPDGLDTKLFVSDKEAYGHHIADVLSVAYYPEDEARLTLFRSRALNDGGGNYKFRQEIAGLPVIGGMIIIRTNDQGEIYFRKGAILRPEDDYGKIDPPPKAFIEKVSTSLGEKSLENIEHQSSCYYHIKETDETRPAHIFYIDARDPRSPDAKKIIVDARTGKILAQMPLTLHAR